ncbi:MAG: zinc metalloprotease HtpX [Nanoarchaeota archaeon]|nr:zinc metalloprotease HtpX [Nanoarchaeota archaeon]
MFGNQIKTVLLLGILTSILLVIGSFFGKGGLIFAGIFVLVMNVGSYWFSDKLVLMMYKAKEVKDKDSRLYKIVKEVKEKANVPMPRVYIIPTESPNAFATGRNPKHAAVAATQGVLELLNDEELEGVIAHEIAHVRNRDILISTIAGTIAGVISYIAFMARWGAIFGGYGRNDGNGNMFELLALAIIAPITATIIQLAISRSREFIADETGARIVHNTKGLASALEKLHANVKHNPLMFGNQATQHIFIVNPFTKKSLMSLFSTHPNVDARIKRLKELNL